VKCHALAEHQLQAVLHCKTGVFNANCENRISRFLDFGSELLGPKNQPYIKTAHALRFDVYLRPNYKKDRREANAPPFGSVWRSRTGYGPQYSSCRVW
jgi:hypothetical protein